MKLMHPIGLLALAVLVCGMALRAIYSPSPLRAASMFTLAAAMFTLALVGACCGRDPARVACTGVAICGWAYLFAIYGPWAAGKIGPTW